MQYSALLLLCGILLIPEGTSKEIGKFNGHQASDSASRSAFNVTHAEDFNENVGSEIGITCGAYMKDDDCRYLTSLDNGDHTAYYNIDFEHGAASMKIVLACGNPITSGSSKIEIRLDSLASTPVASVTVGYTGDWLDWIIIEPFLTFPILGGVHNLYFTYVRDCVTFDCQNGTYDKVANIDWFVFYKSGV